MTLSAGPHVVEWRYEKTREDSELIPIKITLVRIEGDHGPSDTCVRCPMGQYSPVASAKCVECEAGTTPNKNGTGNARERG